VRLSALTESSILRTASLEFDIGFLLDDYFCLTAWHAASNREFLARTRSMFPDLANAGPRSPQRSLAAAIQLVMAFGMPEAKLSRHGTG
jgi:hypothetical protein